MKNLNEKQIKIFEIMSNMTREEEWETIETLMVCLMVKDVKEEKYEELLDAFKEFTLPKARDFKKFVDAQVTSHGNA